MTDPRIHERRVLVARQKGRRRRKVIAATSVLVLLAAGAFAIVHSSVLGARHVEVSGASHTPKATVVEAAGLKGAPPLVDLSASAIAERVERLPWVGTATVAISWPTTVRIRLTERTPVACAVLPGGDYAVMDATGRVLQDAASRPASLPLIAATGTLPAPGGRADPATQELAAAAATMPESMVHEISILTLARQGIEAQLGRELVAILGPDSLLKDKFISLATVLAKADLSHITTIELEVPSSPVLLR